MACACASPNTVLTSTYPYTYTWPYSATVPVAVTVPVAATYSHVPAVVSYTVPAYTKTQYHAQDEQGRASYGYSHPGQSHQTVRDEQGNVQGGKRIPNFTENYSIQKCFFFQAHTLMLIQLAMKSALIM